MTAHLRKFIESWKRSAALFRKKVYVMLVSLVLLSGGVWVLTLLIGLKYPVLVGLVLISYGLGLRHAVDADHIAAIDNTTRKLLSEGKKPISVGLFFSLGHSTVVIVLCMALALFSSFVQGHLPAVQAIGTIIGTGISSVFLFTIGGINALTFFDLVKKHQLIRAGKKPQHIHQHGGLLMKIFRPVFSAVTKSWHMYPVGFLFGLGFDTASEIALLSISATTGASWLPVWTVLLLPFAFTAGMALIDSLDGLLMVGAYGWAFVTPLHKLTYNLWITGISIVVAFGIGGIELLQILSERIGWFARVFSGVSFFQLGSVGIGIIALFALMWAISYLVSTSKTSVGFQRK